MLAQASAPDCLIRFPKSQLLSFFQLQRIKVLPNTCSRMGGKSCSVQCRWWLDRLQSSRRLAAREATEASMSPQIAVSMGQAELNRRLLVTLLTVLFFYFPSIFTTTLAFFTCYHLDSAATFAAYPGNATASFSSASAL